MTVIFQLFCAEDLQRLNYKELEDLKQTITAELGNAQTLCMNLTDKVDLDLGTPPRVHEALGKRFDEVSHQLKSPQLNPSQPNFNFNANMQRRNDQATKDREDLILKWAISCEVNNFDFYNSLMRIKKMAYHFFAEKMKAKGETVPERLRPKGPDSLYSPLNPRHPLYKLFYDL